MTAFCGGPSASVALQIASAELAFQDGRQDKKGFARDEELTREVIDLKLSNYITACEKLTKTKQGTYRSYLSYEIKIDDLLDPLSEKISQDEVLRIDYNYEKFKKNFENALKNNN